EEHEDLLANLGNVLLPRVIFIGLGEGERELQELAPGGSWILHARDEAVGIRPATVVPDPGRDRMVIVPPSAASRPAVFCRRHPIGARSERTPFPSPAPSN